MNKTNELPVFIDPDEDDTEIVRLIESWRYSGPPTTWDDIVGHKPQIERCQELVEKLSRSPEELARLRIRVGAGIVITGPSGVGKSLLARATADALGRHLVVSPEISQLTGPVVYRLYRQLARMDPAVVLLDDAEGLIGLAWQRTTDADALRALLGALDGVNRPLVGPITLALTTADVGSLDPAAIRPGRLAPHLVLSPPSADERRLLLERSVAGIPTIGQIDIQLVVERTAGWTGAELVSAVEQACARSLLDQTDALRMDLLLDVVKERSTVEDDHERDPQLTEAVRIHEAGHACFAELTWPGQVQMVALRPWGGETRLQESVEQGTHSAGEIRRLVGLSLAGELAERLVLGADRVTDGALEDKRHATSLIQSLIGIERPYEVGVIERGENSDRGPEAMRASEFLKVAEVATEISAEVRALLAPWSASIRYLADVLLGAADATLSGVELQSALHDALRLGPKHPAEGADARVDQ